MIGVSVRKDGITVSGHAGYGDPGKDIVCAAVSALVETLIKSIKELTGDNITYDVSPGRVDIHYKSLSDESKILVDSFFTGICLISEQFPENVQI